MPVTCSVRLCVALVERVLQGLTACVAGSHSLCCRVSQLVSQGLTAELVEQQLEGFSTQLHNSEEYLQAVVDRALEAFEKADNEPIT